MPNRLAQETSPYLLQHKENPVDWYPWGPDALEKARREDKPIFLSIGYAACHWCHVMAHESFEDPAVAAILNKHFVSIKVDREERPDIDGLYMNAVVAMIGQGGWPLSVFITPDGRPFYGGTYFPPRPRYGMPAFAQLLEGVLEAWQNQRDQVHEIGQKLADHLRQSNQVGLTAAGQGQLDPQTLKQAVRGLLDGYDWQHGGWGDAPKFPQPMVIEFLLAQSTRGEDTQPLQAATHALQTMSRGGMWDVVGGGFHRYSTDDHWLVPHFEKMLYDNGQLALAYLHAYQLTGDMHFRRVTTETLDFILREMTHPQGGFYSSLDADSEGEEGRFYVWSLEELHEVLTDPDDFDLLNATYGLPEHGNFDGAIVLQRIRTDEEVAKARGLQLAEVPERLAALHTRLLERRNGRVRPGTDDKVLTAWNALALRTFAEAALILDRADYLQAAQRNAHFLLTELRQDGRLLRAWRNGRAQHAAYLEDYAALILGLLALYAADADPRWYSAAEELAELIRQHYRDPNGGFFDTSDDHEQLIARPKDIQDNATPSGNALAALALLRLAAYGANPEFAITGEEMVSGLQSAMVRYPTAFGQWLQAFDLAIGPAHQIALVGHPADALLQVIRETYLPRAVLAHAPYPPPPGSPTLLADRPLQQDRPTAYVCEGFVCHLPVSLPDDLRSQLNSASLNAAG